MDKKKLINLMAGKGLNMSQLADKAHISRSAVYGLVNKGKTPRMDTLGKIANVLGVEPSDLLDM